MSEMVDRLVLVARSVYKAGRDTGAELDDDDFWRLLVRSQIETMRDPTGAMLKAAAGVNSPEETWRVMVGAILN